MKLYFKNIKSLDTDIIMEKMRKLIKQWLFHLTQQELLRFRVAYFSKNMTCFFFFSFLFQSCLKVHQILV